VIDISPGSVVNREEPNAGFVALAGTTATGRRVWVDLNMPATAEAVRLDVDGVREMLLERYAAAACSCCGSTS
jgi:hypothetical protein